MPDLSAFYQQGTVNQVSDLTTQTGTQYSQVELSVRRYANGAETVENYTWCFFRDAAKAAQGLQPGDYVQVTGAIGKNQRGYTEAKAKEIQLLTRPVRQAPTSQPQQQDNRMEPLWTEGLAQTQAQARATGTTAASQAPMQPQTMSYARRPATAPQPPRQPTPTQSPIQTADEQDLPF